MGGSSSKTNTNIKTSLAVSLVARNIMNCSSNSSIKQTFRIEGSYNVVKNVKQVQNLKLSAECAQDNKNIADLQQSVGNAIKQAAESQSVSVLGALGSSDAETNLTIENDVKQHITQENIVNIVNSSNAEQEFIIKGNHNIVDNFSQEQTMDIVYRNSQKVINQMKSVQAIENAADQKGKATQTNFISDIIGSIFGGLQGMMLIWVILIIAIAFMFGPQLISIIFGSEDPEVAKERLKQQTEMTRMQTQSRMQRPPMQRPPQYMAPRPPLPPPTAPPLGTAPGIQLQGAYGPPPK